MIDTADLAGDASALENKPPGNEAERAASPVRYPPAFAAGDREPEKGIGLCLSGGGYRAMLFHLGSLWRLNELGFLPKLDRISSVSGGSITSAFLGMQWEGLDWRDGVAADFSDSVVEPIRNLAGRTIDCWAIGLGMLSPFSTISQRVEKAYRRHLYGDATLQDLPDEDAGHPRFVINATNVQSGAIWRFSRPYMADWRVGRVNQPETSLALAVAASSAFPPFLSPTRMKFKEGQVRDMAGTDLHREPYTRTVILSDGGVYDNLGLETVWKRYRTVLVSDGGGQMGPQKKPSGDWARHAYRTNQLIDNQVRSLRKRQIVSSFELGAREGTYWRIRGRIEGYPAPDTLPCPYDRTVELAGTPTRLKKLSDRRQERLINWGYALCDAGIRRYVDPSRPAPADFPYPDTGI